MRSRSRRLPILLDDGFDGAEHAVLSDVWTVGNAALGIRLPRRLEGEPQNTPLASRGRAAPDLSALAPGVSVVRLTTAAGEFARGAGA